MIHVRVSLNEIEAVYRSRGADFFRLALARTSDREAALDAVQEGFARAIRGRRSYRGAGPLEAWIARCIMNAAHNLARRTRPGSTRTGTSSPASCRRPRSTASRPLCLQRMSPAPLSGAG